MAIEHQSLIDQYVERPPGRGVADARLRDYGVEVWALAMYYQEVAGADPDVVATDYGIPRQAVDAALAYYAEHRDVIDARILLNHDSVA